MSDLFLSYRKPETEGLRETLEDAITEVVLGIKPGQVQWTPEVFRHAVSACLGSQDSSAHLLAPCRAAILPQDNQSSARLTEALAASSRDHARALRQSGVSDEVVSLLQSWVAVQIEARELRHQASLYHFLAQLKPQSQPLNIGLALQAPVLWSEQAQQVQSEDPMRPMSAGEIGAVLGGLSDETVRQRERAGELFSILRPGRKRGREYPAFQAWPSVTGLPLQRVLRELRQLSGTDIYGFFAAESDLLGGLTPVEALVGKLLLPRGPAATCELLAEKMPVRLEAVCRAAQTHAALRAA